MLKGPAMMYTTQSHPGQAAMNNIGGDLDGSGTINPAALNSSESVLPTPTSLTNASMQSPRGQKRSRSPDQFGDMSGPGGVYGENDDRPKKRGRPPKERGPEDQGVQGQGQTVGGQLSTSQNALGNQSQAPQVKQQTQQTQAAAPKQTSPAKPAPGKTVVKALPTVRDHTTDQLNAENDEYIPRETDPDGEKKVQQNGRLTGSREYRCRTFLVPNRGDKLFMLATECARVLGYRDSYLLFNKNRSLYKIIATQAEKDDLIHQDILPYSYRSRQIAIVTARSMFRQFGSRVINEGRRVRDDYWEAKARKQGFTEEDAAGEKRPGAARREAAAQEAAAHAAAQHPPNDVIYSNALDSHGHALPVGYPAMMGNQFGPLPMITPAPIDDARPRHDYSMIARPKQEITSPPYQDRTQLSSMSEIMGQANQTSEFNKVLNAQRGARSDNAREWYKREQPVSAAVQQDSTTAPSMSQNMQSTHLGIGSQQQMMPPQAGQAGYQQPAAGQGSPTNMRNQQPPHVPQRSSTMPYGSGQVPQSPGYGYSNQMWQQHPNAGAGAPQQSPIASHNSMPQYSPQTPGHGQQHPQSPHPAQSPHNLPGQGAQHHQSAAGMQPPQQMGYQMPGMAMQHGYPGMQGRGMYQQPQPAPHTYMQQSGPGAAGGMAGWAPPAGQQGWQNQGY